tara:strand:+ start:7921 stop:9285 length:1365 start_codon:yes stop_codon:yes gene_type:complete
MKAMRSMHHPTRSRLWGLLLALVGFIGTPVPASAQIAGLTEAMKPEFFTRDLIIFIEGLELDETQQIIVEALFEDYELSFEIGIENMNVEIESIQGQIEDLREDPQKVLELVLKPIERWMGERETLGDQLIENVRVILVPEQEARWMEFNRKLYIEQNFSQGLLSGENLNLHHILRDMALDPATTAMIQPGVTDWSIDVMQTMKDRSRLARGPHATIMETINAADSQEDIERKLQLIDARVRVREANDRGIERIAAMLTGEQRDAFIQNSLLRAYPTAYRRTPAQRVLDAAAANTSYSPELQEAIRQLVAEYHVELDRFNAEILQSIQRNEPDREREKVRNRQRKINGQETVKYVSPTKELITGRKEMGVEYIERLRALMSPDQFRELEGARRFAPPSPSGIVPGGNGPSSSSVTTTKSPRGLPPQSKQPKPNPKDNPGTNRQPPGKQPGPSRD